MLACILIKIPLIRLNEISPLWYGVYVTLYRTCWSIALCYIIFACYHFAGPVNAFLGHPLWQPLSRMSLSLYLLQFPVLSLTIGTAKQSFYFTKSTYFLSAIANCVVMIIASIIPTLAIEMPFFAIDKILFQPKRIH